MLDCSHKLYKLNFNRKSVTEFKRLKWNIPYMKYHIL